MFFTFIKETLLHSLPTTLLNLVLFPAMFYFLHAINPQLVLILLLVHYVLSNFLVMAEKQKERMMKDAFGMTEKEMVRKVIDNSIDQIDKRIKELDEDDKKSSEL